MNKHCEVCGGNLWNGDACIGCAMIMLGSAFHDALSPVLQVFNNAISTTPDEKELAQQRSRDDLKRKRSHARKEYKHCLICGNLLDINAFERFTGSCKSHIEDRQKAKVKHQYDYYTKKHKLNNG